MTGKKEISIKKTILLSLIVLLVFMLRIYMLDQVPSGFDPDEAEYAFNAYTLSKYLRNENNEFLPYQVDTYGNYRPLGLVYFMVASLKIFGNTILAVRLPNVILGAGTVLLVYIFLNKVLRRRKIASLAAFLLAINPWHVFLSRASAEPVAAMFFILLNFILIVNYWQSTKKIYLLLIYFISLISLFMYTGVLPLIFLLSASLALYLFLQTKKIRWAMAIPFVVLIIFPIIPIYLVSPGYLNGRFNQTSLFAGQGKEGITLITAEQLREVVYNRATYQNRVNLFFHNMDINTLNDVLNNWTKHLSLEYLYFKGGEPRRLQVPNTGIFLPVEFIFLIGGLLFAFQHKKYALIFLGIAVMMISFLPAGMTFEEVPSTHRPIFATLGFFIFEAYFLWQLARFSAKKHAKIFGSVVILILAYQISVYLHNYLIMQPRHQNLFRHPEMQELARYIHQNQGSYDAIYVTKNNTEPAYFYYFFNNLDPRPMMENPAKSHLKSWTGGKINYLHMPCADVEMKGGKILVIEGAAICQTGGNTVKYIYNSDGSKIYRVVVK